MILPAIGLPHPQDMVKNPCRCHKRKQKNGKTLENTKKTLDLWGGVWYSDYTSPRVFFLCAFFGSFVRREQDWASLRKKFTRKNTRKREDLSARFYALPRVKFRKSGGAIMRVKITMACTECKQRNYDTIKNKKNNPDRLEMNKYCRFCRKHTLHRETK